MKLSRKWITLILTLIMVVNVFFISAIPTDAHPALLDVSYDDCVDVANGDGLDELWYILDKDAKSWHISDEVTTIRYYFAERDPNTGCTWIPANKTENTAQQIKAAYANSMKKWNNVYFYSYNPDGSIAKNKIINIVEGTADNHNLIIYPDTTISAIASTGTLGDAVTLSTETITHKHYAKWYMRVNIDYFYVGSSYPPAYVLFAQKMTGAHEIGHVLGLRDVDYGNICNSDANSDHHQEILMGYGSPITSRSSDITYKDIAGVAITRGFHTDDDHDWLYTWESSTSRYKLICSICNGVKYVESSEAYQHMPYGCCDEDHTLSGGNMMAVASYGNQDYYKCRFCRYVAPFSDIVTQNYTISTFSDDLHKCVNTVNGLTYTFYEEHTLDDTMCTGCGYVHTHTYGPYLYHNARSHAKVCNCGKTETEGHWVYAADIIDGRYATCQVCNYLLDLNEDLPTIINSIHQVSVNGSYILPNGIVVLVEEDVEAYLAGTLQFYHPEDVPVTQ